MNNIRNPFTPMLVTFDPKYVFGRVNEITSLLQVVTAREPSIHAIYGVRTIGKTTILKYLKDEQGATRHYPEYLENGQQLLFVYLNFYRFHVEDALFYVMLEHLHEEIEMHHLDLTVPDFDEEMPVRQIFKLLRQILTDLHSQNVRVVFLLDDFDIPLELLDQNDYRLLRNLSEYAVLIIATERPLSQIKPDPKLESASLLGILRPDAINLLSSQAAHQMILQRTEEAGLPFEAHEVTFLLDFAGRQPFLLVVTCEFYFNMRLEYPEVVAMLATEEGQQDIRTQFTDRVTSLPHVTNLLHRLWSMLTEDERLSLYQISTANDVRQAGNLANKALAFWNLERNSYQVFSHLFREFIYQRHLHDGSSDMQTATELAESLSPIDRAVLQYLLDRPEQVCTFEEIMDGVWGDRENKRALEAAVHRLRKHLISGEEIKNIRGKGYMFVSDHIADTH